MTNIPLLHLSLFVLTFITTLGAGAFYGKNINIFEDPLLIVEGLPFAVTLMGILLVHELSHYFASGRHHVKVSLPYFIPAPTILGTLGAFIKMKSPIYTRSALIDIGASGPLAGFVASMIACIIGLQTSYIGAKGEFLMDGLIRGDSLIFSYLTHMIVGTVPENSVIVLDPIAFAGWIGLFVTSLNLIPVGQLDGGHIAYAFLGDRHKILSAILVVGLAVMGIYFWEGWILWAVILLILRITHPPVYYWEQPLDRVRVLMGILSMIIFMVTFVPSPFSISE
jgi:membrane-associated protease RseP (regulator of RpoE activity)